MKFCPKCQTKYDEEIIRFCTKDGSPLVDDNPTFSAMPSQSSIEDVGEETLISIKRPNLPPIVSPPPPPPLEDEEPAPRVVISINEDKKQAVRPLEKTYQQPPPRQSNTAFVVLLTIFGTIAILGGAFGVWWFVSGSASGTANTNTPANNANVGVNYNSTPSDNFGNIAFNTNANVNTNANTNVNANANANKSPSPTKTPTPKPSPNTNTNIDINSNTVVNIQPSNSATNSATNVKTPTATPTASPATPKPSPTPTSTSPSNVNVGIINSRATSLPKPAYPPTAKQMGAAGTVSVQVLVDESGNVVSAKAVSGHPLLRQSAEAAARQSRFNPIKVGDKPVRANGTLVYNFINQ